MLIIFVLLLTCNKQAIEPTGNCGRATESIEIETIGCNCFESMSDIFSPNDDGINDLFGPITSCELEVITFEIYNRWGQIVYQTDDADSPWDGKFKEVDASVEVYLYLLRYYN